MPSALKPSSIAVHFPVSECVPSVRISFEVYPSIELIIGSEELSQLPRLRAALMETLRPCGGPWGRVSGWSTGVAGVLSVPV